MDLTAAVRRPPLPGEGTPTSPAGRLGRLGRLPFRLALAVLSGLLLVAAFPPFGLWMLAPLGAAALLLGCRGASGQRGMLVGLVAGLAFFLPLLSWTGTVVGALGWLPLSLLQALFFAGLGAALALTSRTTAWWAWSAALWVGEEALRSRLPFGGFPWGRLAFSQDATALTPLAAVGGAPLVTAAVALLGAAVAALVTRPSRRQAVAAVGVLVLVPLAGVVVPRGTDGPPVTVAVVQGNVPRLGLGFNAQRAAVLRGHAAATARLAADIRAGRQPRPELVVWPENASDLDPFTDPQADTIIGQAVRDVGVPVLVGALLDGPGNKISNTGIVWDPVTGPGERYVKRHPVPFGEYIPLRGLVRRVTNLVDLVPRDFAAGTRVGALDVGPVRLGDVICFEVAYDDLVRDTVRAGGQLLVVQTNNATFGRSGETEQQLAMGRLRAVEHGRTVLVAATSGISAVITPDGGLVQRSQVFTSDLLVAQVPARSELTLATRLGAGPEAVLAALGVGVVLAAAASRRSGRPT